MTKGRQKQPTVVRNMPIATPLSRQRKEFLFEDALQVDRGVVRTYKRNVEEAEKVRMALVWRGTRCRDERGSKNEKTDGI